jgi:hypothetical protein
MIWDLFVTNVREDLPIARAAAEELDRRGLSVWLDAWDDREISRATELRYQNTSRTRCGLVFVSKKLLARPWTVLNLAAIVGSHGDRLLPIWCDVTTEDVQGSAPCLLELAPYFLRDGLELICQRVVEAVRRLDMPPACESSETYVLRAVLADATIPSDLEPLSIELADAYPNIDALHALLLETKKLFRTSQSRRPWPIDLSRVDARTNLERWRMIIRKISREDAQMLASLLLIANLRSPVELPATRTVLSQLLMVEFSAPGLPMRSIES